VDRSLNEDALYYTDYNNNPTHRLTLSVSGVQFPQPTSVQ
jgi:hypothetical protein